MRFPATRFQLHAIGKKGAILERDAELILPPVLQPIIILADPVSATGDRDGNTSNYAYKQQNKVGAGAASTADTITFEAGNWLLQANAYLSWTGTAGAADDFRISMFDPTNEMLLWSVFPVSAQLVQNARLERWLHMSTSFFFRLRSPATVAGDTGRLLWSYNLQRVL